MSGGANTAGRADRQVVLTGNPNSGKTTLFNALTGLSGRVGNYPGVTVERKEGRLLGAPKDRPVTILDLPGTYSLSPQSLDEQIARDVLFHRVPGVPPPDLVVVVVDASNLQRNLYFATQVIELGYPTLVALNMVDVARATGHEIDAAGLGAELGVPVIPIVASRGEGLPALRDRILAAGPQARGAVVPRQFCALPPALTAEVTALSTALIAAFPESCFQSRAEALLLLSDEKFLRLSAAHYPPAIAQAVSAARARLEQAGTDWRSAAIEARYTRLAAIEAAVNRTTAAPSESVSDRLDRVVTHRVWGPLLFVGLMALMFQGIFTFAAWPMDALDTLVGMLGDAVAGALPPGALNDLLVNGVIAGVGAVVVFLPQILLLFLFISLLEDSGYMARAAFLMDRLMSKVGLHGKSFIPMLSSFACAIPGIMATRTIESPKDRLVTILVAPLMSCSARLPVYTVLIAACIPNQTVLGFWKLSGLTLLGMYLLGIVMALAMAWLFKKTLLRSPAPLLILELPPYKRPVARVVLRHMWDRSKLFLRRAGTVILGINILLWFLASYPKDAAAEAQASARRAALEQATPPGAPVPDAVQEQLDSLDHEAAGARLRHSLAGRAGHLIEPLIAPLGFDWKMGIGIVASFAAREVFVSTMAVVYNLGEDDSESATERLASLMREEKRPDGRPLYTPLLAVTLMVFYVFALQCVSTIAVVRRETNSWKWPLFQWAYMGALAWIMAFLTYHGGQWLGFE
ncbi:MAG: ferrous iron transport protein [Verrucomicrobiota bacterium]|jgi:ferrous iron transport protein B